MTGKLPAGDYTLDNGDSITVDENQVVVNWIKADAAKEEPVIEEMREEPVIEEVNRWIVWFIKRP